MCTATLMARWDHTSSVIAATYNSRQGIKKGDWIDPVKLNPYRKRKRSKGGKVSLDSFAKAFGAR